MRFRRRIKMAPGLHLNISGSGLSLSAGPKGASFTFGPRGVWANTGIPALGLSSRRKLAGPAVARQPKAPSQREREAGLLDAFFSASPSLSAPVSGGAIELLDRGGNALPADVQAAAWKHLRTELLSQLSSRCEALRADIESLATLHQRTPPPVPIPNYIPEVFTESKPVAPSPRAYYWLWKWFSQHRRRIDQHNRVTMDAYLHTLQVWNEARVLHDCRQHRRQELDRLRAEGTEAGIEEYVGDHLASLTWPMDTDADLRFDGDAGCVHLDVDFPEIEALPEGFPEPAPRTREVRLKRFSEAARRRLYAGHIHSVLFRLVGETFRASDKVESVVASGYSQRANRATGVVEDDYLISVRVQRTEWLDVDFGNLASVDPIEAIARYPHRRKMTKTGIFSVIEPF